MLENTWGVLLWTLICVVAILGLAYWFTRFVVGKQYRFKGGRRQGKDQIEILSQQPLGKDQRIAVARVGTRYFLVGIAPNSVSLLSELKEEDIVCAEESPEPPAAGQLSFREALDLAVKKKLGR